MSPTTACTFEFRADRPPATRLVAIPATERSMRIFGILGGVASGKSLVAQHLAQLGAAILDGDRAGHAVLEQPELREALRNRWGERVFTATGLVDRAAIAQIVFAPSPAGPPELEFLERLTHPRIGLALERQAAQLAAQGTEAAVLDAPVMLKAGWDRYCDKILFVDAPRDVRLERALARGWTADDFARREAAQESLESKRSRADVVIDNSGSAAETRAQIERFWRDNITEAQSNPTHSPPKNA